MTSDHDRASTLATAHAAAFAATGTGAILYMAGKLMTDVTAPVPLQTAPIILAGLILVGVAVVALLFATVFITWTHGGRR